ncbi:uncharacterized protein LOC103705128 isoform X1 [Phoenix dactylifera]|uniref:Uncharacterized protein LOC103705128 isoform X1 n=2 Tax=Phoenix dactylifera TaxID=42345 RepID=A0A8B7BWT7_PHODC|nr:uncharacterized protein LOC103705128 isoform X1 [Phoenix dactylifera]
MASLSWSVPVIKQQVILRSQLHNPGSWRVPTLLHRSAFPQTRLKNLPLLCSKLFPWEASPPYASTAGDSIIKGNNIIEPIDAEDAPEFPILQSEEDVIEMKNQPSLLQQTLKWPMWLLGPSVLLVTGMVPTLWLPLSSVFVGPNIAGLLSLVGLDCVFNLGATLFLLMADACGRPKGMAVAQKSQVPFTYQLWNLGASLLGFVLPLLMLFASLKGSLQPQLPFISFLVLLGPYLLLLSIQMLAEMLTWHWKSPVWLVTPIVYEAYRVLQLMRGLKLAGEVGAPAWMVESIRGLVSWWVLILGIQLMRVAWSAGLASQAHQQP